MSFLLQWIAFLTESPLVSEWTGAQTHSEGILEGSGCPGGAAQEQPVPRHRHGQAQRSDDDHHTHKLWRITSEFIAKMNHSFWLTTTGMLLKLVSNIKVPSIK